MEALFAFREACVSRLELRTGEASLLARVSADPIFSCVFGPLPAQKVRVRVQWNRGEGRDITHVDVSACAVVKRKRISTYISVQRGNPV